MTSKTNNPRKYVTSYPKWHDCVISCDCGISRLVFIFFTIQTHQEAHPWCLSPPKWKQASVLEPLKIRTTFLFGEAWEFPSTIPVYKMLWSCDRLMIKHNLGGSDKTIRFYYSEVDVSGAGVEFVVSCMFLKIHPSRWYHLSCVKRSELLQTPSGNVTEHAVQYIRSERCFLSVHNKPTNSVPSSYEETETRISSGRYTVPPLSHHNAASQYYHKAAFSVLMSAKRCWGAGSGNRINTKGKNGINAFTYSL